MYNEQNLGENLSLVSSLRDFSGVDLHMANSKQTNSWKRDKNNKTLHKWERWWTLWQQLASVPKQHITPQ